MTSTSSEEDFSINFISVEKKAVKCHTRSHWGTASYTQKVQEVEFLFTSVLQDQVCSNQQWRRDMWSTCFLAVC